MNSHRLTATTKLTFSEHIDELRSRVFVVCIAFLLSAGLGYFLHQQLLSLVFSLYREPLYYTTPTAGIDLALSVSMSFAGVLTFPVAVYQLIAFLAPALSTHIRQRIVLVVCTAVILMLIGIAFAAAIMLPATLHFLSDFRPKNISNFVSANSYVSFVLGYMVAFGIVFQLPLVIILWNMVVPIRTRVLLRYQQWVIIGAFIISAILTPTPDPINQTMMALPIILLYELSMIVVYLINRHKLHNS